MQNLDVLCVGDALIDIFLLLQDPDEHAHEADHGKEFCFRLGAKIPVDDAQFYVGGNAANVSVGLSRLGFHTAIVGETGDDMFAHKIVEDLQKERVSTEFLKQTHHAPATFSVNIVLMHDRTILSRHVKRDHSIAFEKVLPEWVYLTSVGNDWEELYEKTLAFVTKHNLKLAFNPGSRQLQASRQSYSDILKQTDILFVNKEEAQKIAYGAEHMAHSHETEKQLLLDVQALGPKVVSMTDGGKGSLALDQQQQMYHQSVVPEEKYVQKTGVGDAYATGFLASIIRYGGIQQAMLWGATNAANVMGHMGAQTGLLRKEEMENKVKS